ncbi:hypothetical protein CA267_004475 [Alteromonas pelagimontana]|uniref:Uncharacterized protein n=1 Tax=Alteromonas pelagimontana TaxID=1858656 RepID=A0A6M4MA84_9ALTE|nr:hypothetical protein [Alteromonas pelagimontana]QJR80084.1 hypothetical protein CA267_004475 [Alteromonas pelagimontana]
MVERTLKLEINDGTWMVNITTDSNDDGKYELLHPAKEAVVNISDEHMQGFDYSIAAHEGTPYKLLLDDIVLAEGAVNGGGVARGSGVV